MPKSVSVRAEERIRPGELLLVRHGRASKADAAIANARAPAKDSGEAFPIMIGQRFAAELLEDLATRDLHALAQGPIMDPLRLNLPAGKLSEEEYQLRLDTDFARIGQRSP